MSRIVTVLAPNGRRVNVNCTPDTVLWQVLENACNKQGLQANDYNLKHHKTVLDLTTTVRFANLPNKAFLEMVDADRQRTESNVTIGLTLEDGERRTGEFPPSTFLFDLVTNLAPDELNTIQNPAILYMRQEVIGIPAMKEKTLKHLGLISGRAIVRLCNKADEQKQANVSSVYRAKPQPKLEAEETSPTLTDKSKPPPKTFDPVLQIKETLKNEHKTDLPQEEVEESMKNDKEGEKGMKTDRKEAKMHVEFKKPDPPTPTPMDVSDNESSNASSLDAQEKLERRLKIEEEVLFVGPKKQKAIVFQMPEQIEEELEDLPDDFYELSVEEVRQLYQQLRRDREQMENAALMTSTKRAAIEQETIQTKYKHYKNAVVRVQFPDNLILQAVFTPADTVEDIIQFIKCTLHNPNKKFHLFTTPFKETLNPALTLVEARFVPCVHMHFKWTDDDASRGPYLKSDFYTNITPSDAANILASKYRAPSAPSRPSSDNNASTSTANQGTKKPSGSGQAPRWFKK